MNFFLHLNKKFLLLLSLIIIITFTSFIFTKQYFNNNINQNKKSPVLSNVDISEPKFAIRNERKNIYVSAKEGNFLSKNEILLKDNVKFKSNDFSIETDNVIFDRNKQTAKSKTRSIFKSKKTTISSDGFDIYDKGNKIIFYGKSLIVLKWII